MNMNVGRGSANPDAGDLSGTAGWVHGGKGGIIMPGKGRSVERDHSPDELDALRAGVEALGLTLEEGLAHLGATTRDIYLNDVAYWRNVPAGVWSYTIGGYRVMKKWLSYRERSLLGRDLLAGASAGCQLPGGHGGEFQFGEHSRREQEVHSANRTRGARSA